MAIDPVCGMEVEEATAAATSEYEGQTYYFCAPGCKQAFDKDPGKYASPKDDGEHHHHNH
jgi:YHS domain-containing protein